MISYTIQSRDITFFEDKKILEDKLKKARDSMIECSVQSTEEVDTIFNVSRTTLVYFFSEEI